MSPGAPISRTYRRPASAGAERRRIREEAQPLHLLRRRRAIAARAAASSCGFAQLTADLRSGSLPTYTWITPNLCDDGHDCGVGAGDRFLARTVPAVLRELGPHGFLVITWDEGVSDRGCCGAAHGGQIATIVAGPDIRRGAREQRPVDHYGVLASIEQALGLPLLAGAADPRAGRLTPLFASAPHVR